MEEQLVKESKSHLGSGFDPEQKTQEAMDAIDGISDENRKDDVVGAEYKDHEKVGIDDDSSGCGIEPKKKHQEATDAIDGQLVGDKAKPKPVGGNTYNSGLRKKCSACLLFKSDLDYSKTQRKKFAQGKGGRCRWCIENRVELKQSEVENTTQRADNTEPARCEDMEDTKIRREEMPQASWLTLGEEEDTENLEETKESDDDKPFFNWGNDDKSDDEVAFDAVPRYRFAQDTASYLKQFECSFANQ